MEAQTRSITPKVSTISSRESAAELYAEFDQALALPSAQRSADEIALDAAELRKLSAGARHQLRSTLLALAEWEELGQRDRGKQEVAMLEDEVRHRAASSGGQGGRLGPLAWRFPRIPTHLPLNSRTIS